MLALWSSSRAVHGLRRLPVSKEAKAMLVLVSGATTYPRGGQIGTLVVPKSWSPPGSLDLRPYGWAMDNGAFAGFDAGAFVRMLERFWRVQGCLFVTAPDVVGDAASTLHLWPFWSRLIRGMGHRPAFVAQDGLTPEAVPWSEMGALFLGGSTRYKESADARTLCGMAKARGLWVHWGRVNGKRRYELAKMAGADSIDGTGFSMYSNVNIPKVSLWEREIASQPLLAEAEEREG